MFYYAIAFAMGVAITMQAAINATLARSLGTSPLVAGFLSLFVGTICIGVVAYCSGALHIGVVREFGKLEWWKFLGGILGAFFLFATILLAPKIGFANMFILALVGQLITSTLLDNFGAFGLSHKPISLEKLIGLGGIIISLVVFYSKDLFSSSH